MSAPALDLKVSSVLVTVTLTFHLWITSSLAPHLASAPPLLSSTAPILASVGFYVLAYNALFWVYRRFLRNHFYPSTALDGEWFYSMKISGKENATSYGLAKFFRVEDELCFQGIHFSPQGSEQQSRVSSNQIVVRGNMFSILYESSGTDTDGVFLRKGVIYLSISDAPPDTLTGVWQDTLAAVNKGDITLRRRSTATDKILMSVGYPLSSAISGQS